MKLIDIEGLSQPDPYILKNGNKYYVYCTGVDGVHCYESESLFGVWRHLGIVLRVAGQKEYWAPCVIKRNGKFYMYYSSMPECETDVHRENLKVAVSDCADGNFSFVSDLLPPFSIDAHLAENQSGLYIFYSVNDYEAEKAGTYIVADKMIDELHVKNKPKDVVRPSLKEEIYEKDRFKKGQDWYTIEGACYFKKNGVHYCIYSANSYLKAEYHLGYAYSKDISDELNKIDFIKNSADKFEPLLCADDTEICTGHNSVIEENGKIYLVYHGRDKNSALTSDDRTARICELLIGDDGKLRIKRV